MNYYNNGGGNYGGADPNDFPSVAPQAVPNSSSNPYNNSASTFTPSVSQLQDRHPSSHSLVEEAPQPSNSPPTYDTSHISPNGGINYSPGESSGNYDPYNVEYRQCSVNQWQSIPSERTDYSQYWESPDSFKPQNFSKNTKTETKCNDMVTAIVFLIVFVLSIALFAYMYHRIPPEDDPSIDFSPGSIGSVNTPLMWKCLGIGLVISIIFNVIHDCYCTFAPIIYIKVGLWVGLIFSVIAVIAPLYYGFYYSVIFPIIMLIFSIIFFCMCKEYIPMSASIMQMVAKLLCRYPSVFLVIIAQCVVEVLISIMFSLFVYAIEYTNFSRVFYIFVILAYFWITLTFSYVIYMTVSGLASSWYFLNDTEYMPQFPVLMSLKRACTTSFGSAAFAALLLAIIQTLQVLLDTSVNADGAIGCILSLLKCIVRCILNCLECCIRYINRYALIYCATYGVPFKEGCRRYMELRCNRFCDVIMNGCIISKVTTYNMLIFSIGSALTGYGVGYAMFKDKSNYAYGFVAAFAFLFAFSMFEVLRQPFIVLSDTILVCYVEAPENLKTSANELYEILKNFYGDELSKRIHT